MKIVKFNSKIQLKPRPKSKIVRKSDFDKKFVPIGDYNFEALRDNLCIPTLMKFGKKTKIHKEKLKIIITPATKKKAATFNHNNVSHTKFSGLIVESVDDKNMFELTGLGKKTKNDRKHFDEYFKTSMMDFCSNNRYASASTDLYPYKAFLQILLKTHKIRFIDFVYAIYTMETSNPNDIKNAVNLFSMTNYLRIFVSEFFNFDQIKIRTKL